MPSTMIKLKMNPCKRTLTAKPETDVLAECLMTMMSQETSYSCVDYLSMTPWQNNSLRSRGCGAVDEYCREQICEWTYRVADYFRIDREVVAVSLNYLDRLLCSCSCDRSMYKLAATTTLHMAVKVVHPQKMGELGILSDLSRGEFEMKDVADMELHILNRLRWKLNPPTTVAFTVYMLDFINVNLPSTEIEDLYVNASFFAELSVYDYFFVTLRSSTIALACVLNALEGMMHDADFMVLHKVRRLHILTRDLSAARNRLWELYERSEECALQNDSRPFKTVSTVPCTTIQIDNVNSPVSSPVSVTAGQTNDRWGRGYNELQEKSW